MFCFFHTSHIAFKHLHYVKRTFFMYACYVRAKCNSNESTDECMRGWASSAHRDARRIVVERCARPVRDAFASSVVRPVRVRARRLSVSLSLSLARDDERGTVRVASRRPVDARRASAPIERDARATDERRWRSLSPFRLDADARARRDDTVTRDDQRRRREDADAAARRVEEGCVFVSSVVDRWIDVAFASFLSSFVSCRSLGLTELFSPRAKQAV